MSHRPGMKSRSLGTRRAQAALTLALSLLPKSLLAIPHRPHRPAPAAPPPPVESEEERQHARGMALAQQRRWAEALSVFQALYEQHHDARSLARVAFCEFGLNNVLEAETHMHQVQEMRTDPWVVAHTNEIQTSLQSYRANIARLRVLCTTPGARATVTVEGSATRPVSLETPTALPVGDTTLVVSAPGFIEQRMVLWLPGGAERNTRVEVTLTPVRPREVVTTVVPTYSGAGPWITLGVGAAALTAGFVFLGLRLDEESAAARDCGATMDGAVVCGVTQLTDHTQHARAAAQYADLSASLLSVGGAAVVSGFTWWLVARVLTRRASTTTTLVPVALRTGDATLLGVGGRF